MSHKFYVRTVGLSQTKRFTPVEHKIKPLWYHEAGLSQTATGYGGKLTTSYMVHYLNRWYRVYSMCYSNCSTEYILSKGVQLLITTYTLEGK